MERCRPVKSFTCIFEQLEVVNCKLVFVRLTTERQLVHLVTFHLGS